MVAYSKYITIGIARGALGGRKKIGGQIYRGVYVHAVRQSVQPQAEQESNILRKLGDLGDTHDKKNESSTFSGKKSAPPDKILAMPMYITPEM